MDITDYGAAIGGTMQIQIATMDDIEILSKHEKHIPRGELEKLIHSAYYFLLLL